MPYPTMISVLFACGLAAAQAPVNSGGQLPSADLYCAFAAMEPGMGGGFVVPMPFDDHIIGNWNGPSSMPAEVIDAHLGLLAFSLPAGVPWVVGFEVTKALYSDSPGGDFYDFGSRFGQPCHVNPNWGPTWAGSQFQHLSDKALWGPLSGDPTLLANWLSFGGPPLGGPGSPRTVTILPLGQPGRIYNDLVPHQSAIPPTSNPSGSGGSLVGANLVMQLGVLDPNATAPPTAKFRLSNAIGLQMLAVPAIAINVGTGGPGARNFGPIGTVHGLAVQNPTITLTIKLPDANGNRLEAQTRIVNGSRISYMIPEGAVTGPLTASARSSTPTFPSPLVTVVTRATPSPYQPNQPLPFEFDVDAQGMTILVGTLTGTIPPGNSFLTLPTSPFPTSYNLDISLYPFDATTQQAGYGSAPSIQLAAQPAAGGPITPFIVPTPQPIGSNAVRSVGQIQGLNGSQILVIHNSASTPVEVVADIVVHR